MKRFTLASLIAPLAIPMVFVIAGRFAPEAFGLAAIVLLFTASATWFVGVPLNLVLARNGKERWWVSVLAGAFLGIAIVLGLVGRFPKSESLYVLSIYAVCGASTATVFHAIWKMNRGKGRANQSLQRNASTMSSSTIKSAVRHG
ncbi:MAG: hypothetical protein IPL39_01075 [Opitutaceae bacterium]|nr:hypothetical protein [Opitutaceae bacterium]